MRVQETVEQKLVERQAQVLERGLERRYGEQLEIQLLAVPSCEAASREPDGEVEGKYWKGRQEELAKVGKW